MLKRIILWPLGIIGAVLLAYLLWAWLAYADISGEELAQRYGGDGLAIANLDGVALNYQKTGNGPVVVLLHSHYYDMGMWDAWAKILEKRYTVIRYDLTSHGLTGSHPNADYSMKEDVRLLKALMDYLAVNAAHIVGSSLGGNISFNFASQYPQNTLSLTLINSGGIKQAPTAGRSGEIPGWVSWVLRLMPTAAYHRFVDWMIIHPSANTAAISERMHAMFRRPGTRTAELQRMSQFVYQDNRPLLAEITAPVLVQWGANNPQLEASQADDFLQALKNSERASKIIYPDCGHVLPMENSQRAIADLQTFLQSIEA